MRTAFLPDEIKKTLESVISQVSDCVAVSKIYLFGSYYNGTYNEDSDIDIAFFVKDKENLLEAHRKINRLTCKYPIDIQPQIFYECELDEKNGIVGEIAENGGEIFSQESALAPG